MAYDIFVLIEDVTAPRGCYELWVDSQETYQEALKKLKSPNASWDKPLATLVCRSDGQCIAVACLGTLKTPIKRPSNEIVVITKNGINDGQSSVKWDQLGMGDPQEFLDYYYKGRIGEVDSPFVFWKKASIRHLDHAMDLVGMSRGIALNAAIEWMAANGVHATFIRVLNGVLDGSISRDRAYKILFLAQSEAERLLKSKSKTKLARAATILATTNMIAYFFGDRDRSVSMSMEFLAKHNRFLSHGEAVKSQLKLFRERLPIMEFVLWLRLQGSRRSMQA